MGILRLLLALVVVIGHTGAIHGFAPLDGFVAVQTFFMISGFYMALILSEKYTGKGSYRLFLSNRFLRIYPMYWLVLLFSFAVNALIYFKTGGGPLQLPKATGIGGVALLTISNLVIFGQDLVMFVGSHPNGHLFFLTNVHLTSPELWTYLMIPPAWSLGVELIFYLIAPLLVRCGTGIIVSIIAASLALRAFICFGLHLMHDPWTHRFFPTEIAFFLAGLLAYRIYAQLRTRMALRPYLLPCAMTLIAFCLAYQVIPAWAVAGVMMKQAAFYVYAWAAIPLIFMLSRRSKIDRYIGELSYPIYIIHYPMLRFLPMILHRLHCDNALSLTEIAATLAASILITWLLAIPLEKLRQRRVETAHASKPVLISV